MLPTAIDFLESQEKGFLMLTKEEFAEVMIKFGRLCAKDALIAAALKARVQGGPLQGTTARNRAYVDTNSIMDAYPEELIK